MGPENSEYALTWEGHSQYVRKVFNRLLQNSELCDVTLYAEGQKIGAHKIFLSACSKYFEQLFKDFKDERPVVVLKGVQFEILKHILNFVYNGETNVEVNQLNRFLEAAAFLKIDGLTENHIKRKRKDSLASEPDSISVGREQTDTDKGLAETVEKYREQCHSENQPRQSFDTLKRKAVSPSPPKLHNTVGSPSKHLQDSSSVNNPDFSKPPKMGKYSLDTPTRVGEWLSDYEFTSQSTILESQSPLNDNVDCPHIGGKTIDDPPIEGNVDVTNIKFETTSVDSEVEEMPSFNQNDFANSLDAEIDSSDDGEDYFLEKQLMKTPLASIDEQGFYLCKICGRNYQKKDSLKKHFGVHVNNTTCTICGKTLSRKNHLIRHLKVHGISST